MNPNLSKIFIVVLLTLLSACSQTIGWQEEVLLSSGQKIIIDRTVKRIPAELGQRRATNYEIDAKYPGTDKRLIWIGSFGLGAIMLDFKDGYAFIVALPVMCDASIKKYSIKNFPYIFMRSTDGKNWEVIEPTQFPPELRNANLSSSYDPYHIGEGKFQTSEQIAKANKYTEKHSSDGYFQVVVPRNKEEWNYKFKNQYHEGCN